MPAQFWNRIFRVFVLPLLGFWLCFDLTSRLMAESFWFQELGYLPAFLLRLRTQLGLWLLGFFISVGFLFGNLALAARLKYKKVVGEPVGDVSYILESSQFIPRPSNLNLQRLLPLVLGLCVLVSLILLYYLRFWQPNISLPNIALPQLLAQLQLLPVQQIQQLLNEIWQLVVIAVVSIAILLNPPFWLGAIALLISLSFGFVLSANWSKVLLYFHPIDFNRAEPLFEQDISFYVFSLPIWELLLFWLLGLFLYGLVAVSLIYLTSGNSLVQGRFPGLSAPQQRHLSGLGSCVFVAIALRFWLARYQLLYSTTGVAYGASYTDVTVRLPVYNVLSLSALAVAILLLIRTVFRLGLLKRAQLKRGPLLFGIGLYLVAAAIAGFALPGVVQRLVVQPNEFERERPYIQRSIALTRQAFALADIDVRTFNPQGELTVADLKQNSLTINNIRLWDTRPLLETNRQLQQIRFYYEFPDADVDRYTLKPETPKLTTPEAVKQQVLIAARELDYGEIPQQAQTWVNEHLVYTHGYGFTLSPVNTVATSGLPEYFVRDIGTGTEEGTLQTSSPAIEASIPTHTPRIYYGEITNNYVMTSTQTREFDYPSGDENVYNTYDGRGGIAIGSWWRRLLFAEYLKDWQMLLTRDFTLETKLLFRRNITQRIRAIAPFLRFDQEPYLVAANTGDTETQSNLYWIVDAYTTSDRYPYSDPGSYEFNYIRNSVKVVIDAYNGAVDFYIADPNDPLITSFNTIFPEVFKPLSLMPVALRSHIRYPLDFYSTQSERLLVYHMTDPQVFYNREDQWRIPTEIYGNKPQSVEPYYLIMRLPTAESEEFILLLPFTPIQRNNLIAWLAARSDVPSYGRLLLYQFPKQLLVYGPEQIEARINQDPVISQQISLWNRQGSRAIQGNLLVIPLEQSLLYVEPLYLEAEKNSLPTLVRVIVAYENRIVMAETLQQALQGIFEPEDKTAPAIIRPIEEEAAPPQ